MNLPNHLIVGRIIARAVGAIGACRDILKLPPLTSQQIADLYDTRKAVVMIRELCEADHALCAAAGRKLMRSYMHTATYFAVRESLEREQDRDYAIMSAATKTAKKKALPPGRMAKILIERQLEALA